MNQSTYRLLGGLCLFFGLQQSNAQLVVNTATTAQDAVNNILLGQGIQAFNIVYTGNGAQIGSFNCPNCNLGIPTGVVMSTGNAGTASGPNNTGSSSTAYGPLSNDPDLNAISAVAVYDACILQFDFIPTGDQFTFRFVFGSDEYPEWINTSFNDSFGFFLSGPGINGPYSNNAINIAQIPGTTTPISINNLNNGNTGVSGPCVNCAYYTHNGTGTQAPYNGSNFYIQADGFTTVITTQATVQCGETYRIKLAIGDGGDTEFNSWVFLEGNSFSSNNLSVGFNESDISPSSNSVYEGCPGGSLTFNRPAALQGDITFNLTYSGSAINGVDYDLMPSQIFFPAGVNVVTIPFTATADGIIEGQENVIITVQAPVACANETTIELFINEVPPLNVVANDVLLSCDSQPQVGVSVSGGLGFYQIGWDTGVGGATIPVPYAAATYTYTVSDLCGVSNVIGTVSTTLTDYPPLIVDIGDDILADCFGQVIVPSAVSGGAGGFTYDWQLNGQSIGSGTSVQFAPGPGGQLELLVHDLCGVEASDDLMITVISDPVDVVLPTGLTGTCLDFLTIGAEVSGGAGGYQYQWQVGGVPAGSTPSIDVQAADGLQVTLTVTDQCGGNGSAGTSISVPPVPVLLDLGDNPLVPCFSDVLITPDVSGGVGTYTYVWTINGVSAGNGSTLTVEAIAGLDIVLNVSDQCGNTATQSVGVDIIPTPVSIDMLPSQNVNCLSNFTVSPTVTGGTGTLQYQWTIDGEGVGNSQTFTYNTTAPLIITLDVSDICGNTATDAISIVLNPVTIVLDISPDVEICPGEITSLSVTASGGIGGYQYSWSSGSSATQITVSPEDDTVYTVVVNDACTNVATDSVEVDVLIPATELYSTGNVELCPLVSSGTLFGGGVEPLSVSFNPDSLEFNGSASFVGLVEGLSEVIVEDFCENVIRFTVLVKPCEITIPNIFTPNGDSANQFFEIVGISGFPGSELVVYNRWGALVYESSNYANNWDGRDLPDGTYYYIFKRSDGENYSGYVMISR